MSQMPPGPPYGSQPNQPPPVNVAPTKVGPAGYASAYSMPPSRSNGWGLASLITGIIGFCIPVGWLAVIFSIFGFIKARTVHTGKGMSVAGLVLGLVTSVAWLAFGGAILALVGIGTAAMKATEGPRMAARQFITDVTAGNMSAAAAQTDGSVPDAALESMHDRVKSLGALKDVTSFSTKVENDRAVLAGVATYEKGTQSYTMQIEQTGGKWTITQVAFTPDSSRAGGSFPGPTDSDSSPGDNDANPGAKGASGDGASPGEDLTESP